jgi:hypothetical protein
MDDREIGFMSYNLGDDNQLFYFGFEVGLEDELEERLTIIAKEILSELGLKECIDTVAVTYDDLDFDNGSSSVFFSWTISGKETVIQFVSLKDYTHEQIIYKDGKYRAMAFYEESGHSVVDEKVTNNFLNGLVKKCPLNK